MNEAISCTFRNSHRLLTTVITQETITIFLKNLEKFTPESVENLEFCLLTSVADTFVWKKGSFFYFLVSILNLTLK